MSQLFGSTWAAYVGRPGVRQGIPGEPPTYSEFRIKLKNGYLLSDMEQDYVFYTPALIYLGIPLHIDLPATFYADYKQDVPIYELILQRNVFRGLVHADATLSSDERTKWCRTLHAVHKEHWEPWRNWLLQTAFSKKIGSGPQLRLYRIRLQTFSVRDFSQTLWLPVGGAMFSLHAFCVETNTGSCFYRQDQPGDLPYAVGDPNVRWADTQKFADALAATESDPYYSAEPPAIDLLPDGVVQTKGPEPNVDAQSEAGAADFDGSEGRGAQP